MSNACVCKKAWKGFENPSCHYQGLLNSEAFLAATNSGIWRLSLEIQSECRAW